MAQAIKRLGIMGGTFDPIHYGHLVAAEGARHAFQLEKVIFIPAGRPPHKTGRQISSAHHRWIMTELAVASNPFFDTSTLEVDRPGYSYTIDTVREVRDLYPGAEIYFITGADAVLEILDWKNVDELLTMCWFIAATRPGYPLGNLRRRLSGIAPARMNRIITMEVPALAISSTEIRMRVQEGRPIKYLLPEPVEAYILNRGLYR
ncbi:nicotinate-nucleotide adenylyltransferase [Desulfofundulus thermobenzoicus]|uniref:Probable nicotinate-nucleotide adenylyltransferase n=1 Tax=Desulfofundulus thermobenzoicus TaxID=29376 RepID=A0A6N7IWG7_9FIRM|nr:nicotinate-nucleotide adenylyltransferase [Desulfofundulus thermobenzoicus]MQL53827.1 nicotinate-nucleotide adenylyltransferase [Desulfofundulus thermobenzoicus]HHW43906.1 nicotinate-nucleotide adenylyltransferase [Desulfotomaculum sp.]